MRRYAQLHHIGSSQQPDRESELLDPIVSTGLRLHQRRGGLPGNQRINALAADEAAFTDAACSEYWTGLNYSVINHLLPELATRY